MQASKAQGKLDRRVIRTRKAIMDAFDRLIVNQGVGKLTVSAIAREADIDRKTFYLHYDSVDDLANYKVEAGLERVLGVVGAARGASFQERIHIALGEVNRIVAEDLDVCSNIASSLSTDQILARIEQAADLTRRRSGIGDELARYIDERAIMTLHFYIAGGLSLYASWLKTDHAQPIETVSEVIERSIRISDEYAGSIYALVSAFESGSAT